MLGQTKLLREAGYRRDHFGKRADAISGRHPVPRPLTLNLTLNATARSKVMLFKPVSEASCRLRHFVRMLSHFGTISDTPAVDLEFNTSRSKGHEYVTCPGRLAIVWDYFGTRADRSWGRYLVPCSLTLNLTLKVKCQLKGHGCVSYSGRLAIV